MARTHFTLPLNARAIYDKAFFERLFQEFVYCNFDDVNVFLPGTSKAEKKKLTTEEFLKVDEKLDSVFILAENKAGPGDYLELYVGKGSPSEKFPNITIVKSTLSAYVDVQSYDAARPFALAGHFQGFIRKTASIVPEIHPFLRLPVAIFLLLEILSVFLSRRLFLQSGPIYLNVWSLLEAFVVFVLGMLFVTSFVMPRGILLHSHHGPGWLLKNLHREPYRDNPYVKLLFGILQAVIGGLILIALTRAPQLGKQNESSPTAPLRDSTKMSH